MLALATRSTEGDIQGAQVGMQTSVLNGQNVGISAGFIVVRMPIPRRSHEGGSSNPVLPMPVANHSVVIELCTDQGVAARFAGHCEIQGDRLVPMGALNLPRRKNAEHGPQGMGHGSCLRECIWLVASALVRRESPSSRMKLPHSDGPVAGPSQSSSSLKSSGLSSVPA